MGFIRECILKVRLFLVCMNGQHAVKNKWGWVLNLKVKKKYWRGMLFSMQVRQRREKLDIKNCFVIQMNRRTESRLYTKMDSRISKFLSVWHSNSNVAMYKYIRTKLTHLKYNYSSETKKVHFEIDCIILSIYFLILLISKML